MLGLNWGHDKKCTVGCSPEKSLYRLDSSDGVDIAEVVGTHDVCCYESVQSFRRFPAKEWGAVDFYVVIIETFVESITNPFGHL